MATRITLFRIGLVLLIIGSIWTGIIFATSAKSSSDTTLARLESQKVVVDLNGDGLGFYVVSSNSYDNILLAKVSDSHGNYIDMKRITNKITVNYFPFDRTGKYTLEITNFADKPVDITEEIGDTKAVDFAISGPIVLVGSAILILAGYKKLRDYITAHPDEKI